MQVSNYHQGLHIFPTTVKCGVNWKPLEGVVAYLEKGSGGHDSEKNNRFIPTKKDRRFCIFAPNSGFTATEQLCRFSTLHLEGMQQLCRFQSFILTRWSNCVFALQLFILIFEAKKWLCCFYLKPFLLKQWRDKITSKPTYLRLKMVQHSSAKL